MRLVILFLFLFLVPLVNANGIGVSPSRINLDKEKSFYLINSEMKDVEIKLNSNVLKFESETIILKSNTSKKINFEIEKTEDGFVKIQTGKGMLNEITLPVISNKTIEELIIEKNNFDSLYLIILFNLSILIIGFLIWKKKSY